MTAIYSKGDNISIQYINMTSYDLMIDAHDASSDDQMALCCILMIDLLILTSSNNLGMLMILTCCFLQALSYWWM